MPGLPLYAQVEERLGRPLDQELRKLATAQVSVPAMARLLGQETGLTFHAQTVRRWLHEMQPVDA